MNYNSRKILTTLAMLALSTAAFAQKENLETVADFHHISAYIVAGLLIALFVMLFSNRVYYYKEKETRLHARQMNTQLGLVLDSNKTQIFIADVQKRIFSLLSVMGEKKKDFAPIDFGMFFQHDDFRNLRHNVIKPVAEGKIKGGSMTVRGAEKNGERKLYEINISVLHRTRSGAPRILLGIQRDVTDENVHHEETQKLAMRFQTVFNSSLTDMIYYDENGILTDINEKACETFHVTNREALLKRKIHITDVPSYREIDLDTLDTIQLSSITDIDKVKATDERMPEVKQGGKMYYEVALTAIRNKDGKLHGVIAAGRDITEMVLSHHREVQNRQLVNQTTKNIRRYIENINYTLKITGVRMVNYNPTTHMVEISSDLNKTEFRMSQIRCASLLTERERRKLRGLFLRMDRKRQGAFAATLETIFHDEKGRNIFQTINMVPVTDKEGTITNYFGMARNDTEMHYTELQLEKETLKAQETEELKNTFLTNMSYEIRTPLNAVLGFAELFNGPHDDEDEPIFAEEIKRNTGSLLQLVNDILYISRLDAKMVEFNYNEVDFATLFDGYCYMGWSTLHEGVSISVDNPYSQLLVTIDAQNLGDVISKFCSIAAKNTMKGSISAKCEYRHGELTITIQDTSPGMGQETLKHIFDRFANDMNDSRSGTGLELPIIKEIIEQMGGTLEIQSELGKGTTSYIIIPCQMSKMERKNEMSHII